MIHDKKVLGSSRVTVVFRCVFC